MQNKWQLLLYFKGGIEKERGGTDPIHFDSLEECKAAVNGAEDACLASAFDLWLAIAIDPTGIEQVLYQEEPDPTSNVVFH